MTIDTAYERERLAELDGHTDGPWRCSRPDMVTHTMDGEQVSFLYLDDGPRVEFQTTNPVEDARLAAAAPDLKRDYLAALVLIDAQIAEIERLRATIGALEGAVNWLDALLVLVEETSCDPENPEEFDEVMAGAALFEKRARAALSEREP